MKSSMEFLFKKRSFIEEIKKIDYKKMLCYIFLFLSFFILSFYSTEIATFSMFFNIAWILFFIGVISLFKKKTLIYNIFYILFLILFVVEYFYIRVMGIQFSISEIFYAGEGLQYIGFIISKIDFTFIILFLVFIFNWIIGYKTIKTYLNDKKRNIFTFLLFLILAIFIRQETIIFLGGAAADNSYYIGNEIRNIYNSFDDRNKAYQLCGIYEYHIRDIYLFIKNNYLKLSPIERAEISNYFKENKSTQPNEYSGIFKDKNLIVILGESIDSWLVDENTMPTVYNMQKNGLNFTNRYAPFFGGGRTLNTEYALNTGLYIPNNYIIHNAVSNYYSNSLPNMFNKYGYKTSSIHFNSGKFYNRENLHRVYGYSNYYFLEDLYDEEYINDYDVINNEEIYNLMISKNEKFMTFFITYSVHLPYSDKNELCSDIEGIDSISCIKKLSGYTDNAIKLLLEKLERDNLLDNTVIAFVSDHYAYGIDNDTISKIKGGSSFKAVERIPFFIWSNDIEKQEIDKYVDTQDIVPTILNLFGMESKNSTYLGTDVFSDVHKNFVYFNDKSYIGDSDESKVSKMIRINDLIVKGNYH